MPTFKRIVTFMSSKSLLDDPIDILLGGSRVITYQGKRRVFTVRDIICNDQFKILYSRASYIEKQYSSLQELKSNYKGNKSIFKAPILDNDHKLNVWRDENNT